MVSPFKTELPNLNLRSTKPVNLSAPPRAAVVPEALWLDARFASICYCYCYSRTGKVRLMAKNIGFRMELLGTPKVRLGVPA